MAGFDFVLASLKKNFIKNFLEFSFSSQESKIPRSLFEILQNISFRLSLN